MGAAIGDPIPLDGVAYVDGCNRWVGGTAGNIRKKNISNLHVLGGGGSRERGIYHGQQEKQLSQTQGTHSLNLESIFSVPKERPRRTKVSWLLPSCTEKKFLQRMPHVRIGN